MLYTPPSDAWHCTWWCEVCMQLLSYGKLFHEALPSQFLCWHKNASGSLNSSAMESAEGWWLLRTIHHSVTERSHSVTLHGLSLHDWVAAVPKFFNFPIMSLTVDRGISRRDDISQTDSLQRWHPVSVPPLWMLTAWLGALFLYTFGLIETP